VERRANISERKLRVRAETKGDICEKQVFVYEDHRTILNVLDHARRANAGIFPLNLVYLDYHSDARDPVSDAALRLQYRQHVPNQEAFWTFVEWRTAHDDGDWLKTGMDLGLIQDAVLIGARLRSDLTGLATTYTDVAGVEHKIYDVCHIWCALQGNGWLVDAAQHANLKPVWDIMGWQNNAGKFSFIKERAGLRHFVLDFDLDYFTTDGPTGIGHLVWPPEQVHAAFRQNLPPDHFAEPLPRPIDFLQFLTTYSRFITIARESPYCGGYRASAQIMETLDSLIFNGQLTANS
jgi:hypothetical protein